MVQRLWLCAVLVLATNPARAAVLSLQIDIPAGALTGKDKAPPITVSFMDAGGAVDPTAEATIYLEMGANPTGASLLGNTAQKAVQGVAVFRGLSLNRGGDGFTLVAWSPRVADKVSAPFKFVSAPDPHEVLGYGCSSGGPAQLALFGLAVLFLRRRRFAPLLLILCLAGSASAATAPIEVARSLNKRGLQALKAGNFDEAIAAFEEARKAVSSPAVLYNLTETYRLAGQVDKCLDTYHAYLAAVPDPTQRSDVSDFERLERQRTAARSPEAASRLTGEPGTEPPVPQRHFIHAPGVSVGAAWLPSDQRVGMEAMLEIRGGEFLLSAGALVSRRPGARLALERTLVADEDFSFGVAVRGLYASFPGGPLKGGGGGLSFRFQPGGNFEVICGAFLEYYATLSEHFLSPIVTAGIGWHL